MYIYMYSCVHLREYVLYRPCAADVRRLNFLDIYRILTFFEWQKTVVSIAFSRKSALGIMSRQYVVQFQLGTTRLLRFIDFLLAVERTQQIMDSTTLYCIVSCHSKWRIRRVFPYISVLDDVTAQGLYIVKEVASFPGLVNYRLGQLMGVARNRMHARALRSCRAAGRFCL